MTSAQMTSAQPTTDAIEPTLASKLRRPAVLIGIGLLALVSVAALIVLAGHLQLLMPAEGNQHFGDFDQRVRALRGPATTAFGSVSGLGLLAGGAMTGMGMQSGIRMMTLSGLAGGGVVLGNGVVA